VHSAVVFDVLPLVVNLTELVTAIIGLAKAIIAGRARSQRPNDTRVPQPSRPETADHPTRSSNESTGSSEFAATYETAVFDVVRMPGG